MNSPVELGSGLIAIGRQWGTTPEIPSDTQARRFLEASYDLGVRFYDTAPSYGESESRLGAFLATLDPSQLSGVTVATKFGEHWDEDTQTTFADHSIEALLRSLEQSTQRLGHISLLQLHKTTPEVLRSTSVAHALDYAKEIGIPQLGASVSDPDTARMAILDSRFNSVQLPYNQGSGQFLDAINLAVDNGVHIIVNRPFQMGRATERSDAFKSAVDAFRFIMASDFGGTILTGTSNIEHLQQNIAAFQTARQPM
jgi:aryl-alcohol dehydrogenase-like predicted oxidoreductase